MLRIVIESDHFLKILPVMLDPMTPREHVDAVADFFAHDIPDFAGWCATFRKRLRALIPAEIVFAEDQADFDAKLAGADLAIVESFAVTRPAMERAPKLVAVQRFGAIPSGIDTDYCQERRIPVLTVRRTGNVAVAEQAFALMMALSKRLTELNGVVTAKQLGAAGYPVRAYDRRYTGGSNYARIPALKTMFGGTLGIVGLGEVGREIAARANAFGMSVVYHQRSRAPTGIELALGARQVPLEELMSVSDYIVVQLPLTESTRGIIGRKEFAAIKPGAILVNVARAALFDRDALVEVLESGRLGGLGMDVGYEEPWTPDDPLLKFKDRNVILMPHTAIGDRWNGLNDLIEVCIGLERALHRRKRHVRSLVEFTSCGGM